MSEETKPRVFISHSSDDKPFVRKLAKDLSERDLHIWIDERELAVGDSIVAGISEGLKDTDYLVVVLSPSSVKSQWVKAELNAALMDNLSNGGTTVLPVLIAECEIPVLLKERLFADFRSDYNVGLTALSEALEDESKPVQSYLDAQAADSTRLQTFKGIPETASQSTCREDLSGLSLADLRRRMQNGLDRTHVADVWFDTFDGDDMDDDMPQRPKNDCIRKVISKAKQNGKFDDLLRNLCENHSGIAGPAELGASTPSGQNRPRVEPSRLPKTSEFLIGRSEETQQLDDAWNNPNTNLVSIVAPGGVGKTQLIKRWRAGMSDEDFRGATRVFDWSFYSQGTKDAAASADIFVIEALEWFGETKPEDFTSAWAKGARIAELVKESKTLLILDGLEPLQHPPGPMHGSLTDQAIEALLKGLCESNPGLCVVTTRVGVTDLSDRTAPGHVKIDLRSLNPEAGAELLESYGVTGEQEELEQASEDYDGHALALILLATHIRDRYRGNILERNRITWPPGYTGDREARLDTADLLKADEVFVSHMRKVIASYVAWFENEEEADDVTRAALSIVRLMGLFNRPADSGCVAALRESVIEGLTEPLFVSGDSEALWRNAVLRLRKAGLLTEAAEDEDPFAGLDAHPHVRQCFAEELARDFPKATQEAHRRLFERLKQAAPKLPENLPDMMPLYHAVAHGCAAGLQQSALDVVYFARILRRNEAFSIKKLGALGADFAAVDCFFDGPRGKVTDAITEEDKSWILHHAGFLLRALGRLEDAAQSMLAGLEMDLVLESWKNAASAANSISELHLTRGAIGDALQKAEHGVELADRGGHADLRMISRSGLANGLHDVARRKESLAAFREAESMQKADQPMYPILYSVRGVQYCDLLLDIVVPLQRAGRCRAADTIDSFTLLPSEYMERCRNTRVRCQTSLEWAEGTQVASVLDIAQNHLTLGRTHILEVNTRLAHEDHSLDDEAGSLDEAEKHLYKSVDLLRQAGAQHHLPRGLLTRAGLFRVLERYEDARRDLVEAESIAKRGGMLMWQVDAALERCRLALAQGELDDARDALALTKELVKKTEAPYVPHVPDWEDWDPPSYVGVFKEGEIVGYHRHNHEIARLEQLLDPQ